MADAMKHRGPDDSGEFASERVGMSFRRLSIIDLSLDGHQPMSTPDGRLTIVFNGEIYNYVELRKELEEKGVRFRSRSDTEVLLKAYDMWRAECLERLNGMFAFIVFDAERQELFGARDRFGIKPLYACQLGDRTLWASEIKGIRASGLYKDRVNWSVVSAFLLEDRLDDTPATFFEGISSIPAGTAFQVRADGETRTWRYWSIDGTPWNGTVDPPTAFAELFEDAVKLRLRSDVPTGVCLSGGLDSTATVCSMARQRNGDDAPLRTFCYRDPQYDESEYVADTIATTGAELFDLVRSPVRLWERLPDTLAFQDEPVHTMTAVVGFELMGRVAGAGVKVVLNGQGADEVLGGYSSFHRGLWHTQLRGGQWVKAWRNIADFTRVHGGSLTGAFTRTVRHTVQSELARIRLYRSLAWARKRRRLEEDTWFEGDLTRYLDRDPPGEEDQRLRPTLERAITAQPLPLFLRLEDRNSSAHSVESRLPFLDHRVVNLAFSLDDEWKLRGRWNKVLLREAMTNRIPESVRTRPEKYGFPVAQADWFRDDLYGPLRDVLSATAARERGLYDTTAILRDLERHRSGRIDVSGRLFLVAELEIWLSSLAQS
jgi:asparagine synthase (glutamine-hydrolysing)